MLRRDPMRCAGADDLADPGPQSPGGPQLGHREELVGRRRITAFQLVQRGIDRQPGRRQGSQVGHPDGQ